MAVKKTVPFYWGNYDMNQKVLYLLDNPKKHDVLFFGSSLTYRHIDPLLFDSITNCNSFNMGYAGVGSLESDYLIEKISSSWSIDTTTHVIYIKRFRPGKIDKKNLHSVESKYFLDYKRYTTALEYFYTKGDYVQISRYTNSYLENLLCIGELRRIIQYKNINTSFYSTEASNRSEQFQIFHKGFYPLDIQLDITKNMNLQKRRDEYINSSRYLKDTINTVENMILTNSTSTQLSANKISLYRLEETKLPRDFCFDNGHFNKAGAEIFSLKLAQIYKEMVEKENRLSK